MNQKERDRLAVFRRVEERPMTLKEAADRLGLSYRQTRRQHKRYREVGDAGLASWAAGGPGNNRRAADGRRERAVEPEDTSTSVATAPAGVWTSPVDANTMPFPLFAGGVGMQLMTWPLARLGSRFGLLFEPDRRRVMHAALGRFLDEPLDLAVGLIEPDGTERVLPFTEHGQAFYATEQFERINSITYRGHSETCGLRFELNLHSPFYPRDERLCTMPAFYVELRVAPAPRIRLRRFRRTPDRVRLFLRLRRPNTRIEATEGRIDMRYDVPLRPRYEQACGSGRFMGGASAEPAGAEPPLAHVVERLHSLNEGATPVDDEHGGRGLTLELPVTEEGSGIKWRLVWAAHTADPVLDVRGTPARLRYLRHWDGIDAVMDEAIRTRDDNLAHSRRFEKMLEQAPLNRARWHLLVLAFQSYLSNTFWCDRDGNGGGDGRGGEVFSVWEGNLMYHNTLDVAYNFSMFYLALWPDLLRLSLDQWAEHGQEHAPSGGFILHHDMGCGLNMDGPAYSHPLPVEENSNFLLLLQAYAHWAGDTAIIRRHAAIVRRLAAYLLWCDTDGSGFPSEGVANTLEDGSVAVQLARKQTYLAVKRTAALDAAADLLFRAGENDLAEQCRDAATDATPRIERRAWLADHYAVCVDRDAQGLYDTWSGEPMPLGQLDGWDDYSIYTTNGLLLPAMTAQPFAFDRDRLRLDVTGAHRESARAYGCGHTSSARSAVWISQNLWRDHTARYLHAELWPLDERYWDLMAFSNTHDQSFGYIDTYIGNELAFNPRGAVAFGAFLAGPRLVIDRLDEDVFVVNPDRNRPQRWPLLPLADWAAGKIPICVVSADGQIHIEGEIEPVKVLGHAPVETDTIG